MKHRILTTKLLTAADLHLFHGSQQLLLTCIFAIQLLHLGLLSWSMRTLGGWRDAQWRTGTGLAAFCLFCLSQWENLVWGFQVQFVLPLLMASIAFIGLLLSWQSFSQSSSTWRPWLLLLLAGLAAETATASLSSGILLWPVLVAAAIMLQIRRSALIVLLLAAAAGVATFLYGYQQVDPNALRSSLRAPGQLLQYISAYLGSTWTRENIRAAVILGFAAFVLAILLTIRTALRVPQSPIFFLQLVLTVDFCMACAVLTGIGRLALGIHQVFASRYQSVALLFWCCSGLMLLGFVGQRKNVRWPFLAFQVLLLAILLRAAEEARFPFRDAMQHGFELNAAAMSLLTGVDDKEQLKNAFPRVDVPMSAAPYLRQNHLSVFAGPLASQLGEPLASVYQTRQAADCEGEVDAIKAVEDSAIPGFRIDGWAWDAQQHGPPTRIVLVSEGMISGYGAVGGLRFDVRKDHPEVRSRFVGWTGYLHQANHTGSAEIYAVPHGDSQMACRLGEIRLP